MYSFYGGRPGNSFVIVKAFSSIDEMNTNFALGPNYTEVHYDEHVIINTENKNDQHNGELYRRGYNGAVYIGTIVGPAGRAPMLQMTTESDVKSKTAQQGQDSMKQQGSYSVENNSLVPGKEGNKFNDAITWASCCIRNQNNSDSTAYIGFTIPYTTFEWSIQPVTPENSPAIIRAKKNNETDEDHPFYEKLTFQLPIGESFDNLRIGESTDFITVNGQQQSCEGALICDYYDYSTNPPIKNIKKIGDPNMISNIQMNDKNQIIVTWKLDSTQTNLGAINEIQQIAVDDNNNLLIIYSDPTRMGDQSQLISYNDKKWKRAGSIKTISGTKIFYQDEDPQDDEKKPYDLNFHKMSDGSREFQIYIDDGGFNWNIIKLSSTSIKSIKPNQIESEILNRLDDGAINATTEIINYGKVKLDQNGTIYTEKIVEGTDGTQTTEEQVKISSNDGLFAKKGTIGGWTIEENKLSTSFVETNTVNSVERTGNTVVEINSQTGTFLFDSESIQRNTLIEAGNIILSRPVNKGAFSQINSNGIFIGTLSDPEQSQEIINQRTTIHNNELIIANNTKYSKLTYDNLQIRDPSHPALADGTLRWKVLSARRQILDTLYVTIYHCGNLFWAHFDGSYDPNHFSVDWHSRLDAYIPIIENDDSNFSISKRYAPPTQLEHYVEPQNPWHPRMILRVKPTGQIGLYHIIPPSSSKPSDTNMYDVAESDNFEQHDLFWAHIG